MSGNKRKEERYLLPTGSDPRTEIGGAVRSFHAECQRQRVAVFFSESPPASGGRGALWNSIVRGQAPAILGLGKGGASGRFAGGHHFDSGREPQLGIRFHRNSPAPISPSDRALGWRGGFLQRFLSRRRGSAPRPDRRPPSTTGSSRWPRRWSGLRSHSASASQAHVGGPQRYDVGPHHLAHEEDLQRVNRLTRV